MEQRLPPLADIVDRLSTVEPRDPGDCGRVEERLPPLVGDIVDRRAGGDVDADTELLD